MNADLPEPVLERWQPLRCGLLNLYKYDDQTFVFEGGRLLLRGNNGTGKSRALALTLPFLLDGEMSPHRVEPDAEQSKKMEWNLLMGKRDERTGYSWIEFGRRLPDGSLEFLTLGCGLRASVGRPVQRWLFLTPRRIGRDLHLAKNRTPLIEAALTQELTGSGEVFRDARRYRIAVDQRLFGLGIQRYEALVSLLIQLRKPQLTRKLDEEQLSQALSEALPPLSKSVLDDVAEAFRELDDQREQLIVFRGAHAAVADFLEKYRHYVQVAARIRARAVGAAQKLWRDTQRLVGHHQRKYEEAEEKRGTRHREKQGREAESSALTAKIGALKEDPALKDMEGAQREATVTQRHSDDMASELAQAQERLDASTKDLKTATASELEAVQEAEAKAFTATTRSRDAALEDIHREALGSLDLRDPASVVPVVSAKSQLADRIARRRTALAALEGRVAAVSAAEQALAAAREKAQSLTSEVASAEEGENAAHLAVLTEGESLAGTYRAWLSNLQELRPPDAESMTEALDAWIEHRDGAVPLAAAIGTAHSDAQERIAAAIAAAKQLLDAAEAHREELAGTLATLRAGRHEPPPAPPSRDPAVRESLAGAALWQVCDFREGLSPKARANLEAALEASGLLDAWILPDGRILGPDQLDTVLHPQGATSAPPDRTLARVLHVDTEHLPPSFSALIIESILARIGFGEGAGEVWIADDGQWQIGPLRGSWKKAEAQHIGAAAREAERQRRIEAIARDLADAQAQCDSLRDALATATKRRQQATAEQASAPTDDELRKSALKLDLAKASVAQTRERLTAAETQVREIGSQVTVALAERDKDARDFGLFEHLARLVELTAALHEYEKALLELWPALEILGRSRTQTAQIRQRAEQDQAQVARRAEFHQDAHQKAVAASSRLETLRSTVGADVDELLRQLSTAENDLQVLNGQIKADQAEIEKLIAEAASAQTARDDAQTSLSQHDQARTREANHLRDFAQHHLLLVAHDNFSTLDASSRTTAEIVGLAREVEQALPNTPYAEDHWNDLSTGIHSHVETLRAELLPHNYSPSTSQTPDGVLVVSVPYQGTVRTMTEVRAALTEEITTREGQLTRDERRVIEKYLLKDAAQELHQRLHAAETWRDGASEQLQSRPMGSGMRLRFAWEPRSDGPTGLREAIKLLRRHGATWSEKESQDLGAFLADRIREAHRASEGGKWEDHLEKALDYRAWHLFTVERWQDGRWERLTKRRHGTGSGGEKAVALTLPQFTAAATFYGNAPSAPRLILLDEAFVGVDSDMRRKCMDLLATFDLDLVMTSEREWGTYPTVPALAIYQLASAPDVDAIAATRFVWNGRDEPQIDERLHLGASNE